MRKKTLLIAATAATAAVVVAVAGFGIAAQGTGAPSAPPPQTARAQTQTITQVVTGKGTMDAASKASASFKDGGRVTGIAVAVGQAVAAGQQLATVDTAAADAALAAAKDARWSAGSAYDAANAQLATAQRNAAAARAALAAAEPGSPDRQALTTAVTDADAQVASASAAIVPATVQVADADRQVAAAQATVAATTLTAPIAGVVTAINGTIGSMVSGGGSTPDTSKSGTETASGGLIQIADTANLIVTTSIAEADIAKVAVGQKATVTVPSMPAVAITGAVASVSPTPTTTDGVVRFPVVIQLFGVPQGVRLGLTALVSITTQEAKDVLALPVDAVTLTSTAEGTVEVQNAKTKKASTTTVTVGLIGTEFVEITKGLKSGDTVVIPTVALIPGDGSVQPPDGFGGGGQFGVGG